MVRKVVHQLTFKVPISSDQNVIICKTHVVYFCTLSQNKKTQRVAQCYAVDGCYETV